MALSAADENNRKLQQFAQVQEKLSQLKEAEASMHVLEQTIQREEKALLVVKPLEREWAIAGQREKALREEIVQRQAQLVQAEERCSALEQQYAAVQPMQADIDRLTGEITAAELQLPKYAEAEQLRKEKNALVQQAEAQEKTLESFRQQRENAEKERQICAAFVEEHRGLEALLVKAEHAQSQLEQRQSALQSLQEQMQTEQKSAAQLSLAEKHFTDAEAKHSKLRQQYDAMETDFFRSQAGILAQKLQPGQCCPVCGSTAHPMKAVLPDHAPSEAELQTARAKLDQCHSAFTAAAADCRGKRVVWEEKQRQTTEQAVSVFGTEIDPELLADCIAEAAEQLETAQTELQAQTAQTEKLLAERDKQALRAEQLARLLTTVQQQTAETESLQEETKTALSTVCGKLETLLQTLSYENQKQAAASLEQQKQQRDTLKAQLETARQALLDGKQKAENLRAVLTEKEEALPAIIAAAEEARAKLKAGAAEAGFASSEEYKAALAGAETLASKKKQTEEYRMARNVTENDYHRLAKETAGKTVIDLQSLQEEKNSPCGRGTGYG